MFLWDMKFLASFLEAFNNGGGLTIGDKESVLVHELKTTAAWNRCRRLSGSCFARFYREFPRASLANATHAEQA